MDRNDDALLAWASAAAARTWAGARVETVVTLRGDLSTRRFFRLRLSGPSPTPAGAILIDLGPHDLPGYIRTLNLLKTEPVEPPWIEVHRFLTSLGAPVPSLYAAGAAERALLVEDLGDLALFDAARAEGARSADLYRLAVEELLRLHVEGTRRLGAGLVAARIAYDERLFFWELKEFIELGCDAVAPGTERARLEPELSDLAARLGRLTRVFSHRDYHGWNLLVQRTDGREQLRIIDFQDALMAPPAQDLAVLLTTRNTGTVVSAALERRLLDFYWTGLGRRDAQSLSAEEFDISYRLCVLQHALKMIGRFLWFERNGRTGYSRYVPDCVAQARRILGTEVGACFPNLRHALGAAPAGDLT